ncbi:glycosyltransferase family 2 protein [soil metagenome]
MHENRKLISIIIPAFKQKKTIKKDILRIVTVMGQLRHDFEIIVVIDGDIDGTFEEAKKIKSNKIQVFSYEQNRGKGYAIRFGIKKAVGDIIGFIDSGMEIHPNGIAMLLEHMEWYDAHIIVGSKRHPASKVTVSLERKIISKLAQIFVKVLFGIGVTDTQVGIKFFKRKVLEDVFSRLVVKEFAFDIEVLAVAKYLGYKRIFEAPIQLYFNAKGSLISKRLLPVLWYTFVDTLGIFYRMHILHYYANKNRKQWKLDPELKINKSLSRSYR